MHQLFLRYGAFSGRKMLSGGDRQPTQADMLKRDTRLRAQEAKREVIGETTRVVADDSSQAKSGPAGMRKRRTW